MPAAYTHYKFGLAVLEEMPDQELKNILETHQDLFNIGVHGPDILFYYKPLQKNDINKLGSDLHDLPARAFFEKGRELLKSSPTPQTSLAYLAGFICHLALDHACHSYVEFCVRTAGLSHTEVETYLDRSYLLADDKNPLTSDITAHVLPSLHAGEVIAPFFDHLSSTRVNSRQLVDSLKQMNSYNRLLLPTNPLKEGFVRLVLKLSGKYDSLQGLIMKHSCDGNTAQLIARLQSMFTLAVPEAVDMILHFYHSCREQTPLDQRFDYDFSYIEDQISQYIKEASQ